MTIFNFRLFFPGLFLPTGMHGVKKIIPQRKKYRRLSLCRFEPLSIMKKLFVISGSGESGGGMFQAAALRPFRRIGENCSGIRPQAAYAFGP